MKVSYLFSTRVIFFAEKQILQQFTFLASRQGGNAGLVWKVGFSKNGFLHTRSARNSRGKMYLFIDQHAVHKQTGVCPHLVWALREPRNQVRVSWSFCAGAVATTVPLQRRDTRAVRWSIDIKSVYLMLLVDNAGIFLMHDEKYAKKQGQRREAHRTGHWVANNSSLSEGRPNVANVNDLETMWWQEVLYVHGAVTLLNMISKLFALAIIRIAQYLIVLRLKRPRHLDRDSSTGVQAACLVSYLRACVLYK